MRRRDIEKYKSVGGGSNIDRFQIFFKGLLFEPRNSSDHASIKIGRKSCFMKHPKGKKAF